MRVRQKGFVPIFLFRYFNIRWGQNTEWSKAVRIILPKTMHQVDFAYGPFFFLIGPVRGGGDWQYTCCLEIQKHIPHFTAAIPCRYGEDHPLKAFCADGLEYQFDRQLSWERYYIALAARVRWCHSTVIAWLPTESKVAPHPGPEPYAMDTRGEIGEWRGQMMYDPSIRFVIGAEAGFFGLSQIQRNFDKALRTQFPIYPTLAETVAAAVKKAK